MNNPDFAQKIKKLRVNKALTQEQLAENSKLSLRTIQRIEKGETVPRGDTLLKLTTALGVSPDDVLRWDLQEDRGYLNLLNLSALTGIFIQPILGIIIPLVMWILKKEKIREVDAMGKSLISFEITWTLILYITFIIILKVGYIPFEFNFFNLLPSLFAGKWEIGLIVLLLYYGYHLFLVVFNLNKINKGKKARYRPNIPFLGK